VDRGATAGQEERGKMKGGGRKWGVKEKGGGKRKGGEGGGRGWGVGGGGRGVSHSQFTSAPSIVRLVMLHAFFFLKSVTESAAVFASYAIAELSCESGWVGKFCDHCICWFCSFVTQPRRVANRGTPLFVLPM